MVNSIYAKYQIITGKYTYGNASYDSLVNRYCGKVDESYFTRFNILLTENLEEGETVRLNESQDCSELLLNESKVCACDKETGFVYGNLNFGIRQTVNGTLTEEELSALNDIVDSVGKDGLDELLEGVFEEESNTIYSDRELVCDFIMRLEGYAVRLKEMHWDADKKSEHEVTEKTYKLLYDLEDSIAEDMMGYLGSYITPGTIQPVLPKSESLEGLLNLIKDDATEFYKRIEHDDNCIGIRSEVESFIHDMNQIVYLSKMS